ncbi:hypothetical protein LJC23_00410 [Desulfovibrio sp. OttesenSCG-928-I05]|nr:hypothetical protein [Desulfovibrio sp. OttesenSCG-928-I05]
MIFLRAICLLFLTVYALHPLPPRQELESVKLVNLTDTFSPWSLRVRSDCTVTWDNSSSGYLLFNPERVRQDGRIDEALCNRLFGAVVTHGYAKERPLEGVELAMKLLIFPREGKWFANHGPNTYGEEKDVAAFAEIERYFAEAAAALDIEIPRFYREYDTND